MKKVILFVLLLILATPFQLIAQDYLRGDCDQDGNVNISDVTTLIDFLLNGQWPNSPQGHIEIESINVKGIIFNMIKVEGGTFIMGATEEQVQDANSDEIPAHQVTLSDFRIGQTEVTQALWLAVMGSNPSNNTGNLNYPVESVTWNDCQAFISKLNELTGKNFRLPTEAEWEFAARGGIYSEGFLYAGSDNINEVAWHINNSGGITHAVATKAPNELGLYDMTGNVCEWCQDYYGGYSAEPQINPTGPTSGSNRVLRSGSYRGNVEGDYRVSFRYSYPPTQVYIGLGLRLVY